MISVNGTTKGGTVSARSGAYVSSTDVHRLLVFLLCGAAAEDVIIGEPSYGVEGSPVCNLAIATGITAMAAASLSLDSTVGLVWSGMPEPANLRRMLADDPALASSVRAALDTAYADALALMQRRHAAVVALASALIARRMLDGKEAAAIVAQHPAGFVP